MKRKLNASIIIRSILFWSLAVLALPIYCVIALCVIKLNSKLRHKIIVSAAYYFTFLLKYVGKINYRIIGKENIIRSKPVIYAANHQSAWETVVFNCFLPPLVWIMKKQVFNIPFYGWAVRAMSTIAINRAKGEDALQQVIVQGKQRFETDFSIAVFPEGTRVKPGARKPFKYGVSKLAISLGVEVVPIAHNAGIYLPRNSFWLYPGTVEVVIGEAIYPDSEDPVAYAKKLESWIYGELAKM